LSQPIWTPGAERVGRANMTAFLQWVRRRRPAGAEAVSDFPALYRWSVERPEAFWPEVWRFCGVVAEEREGREPWDDVVVGLDRMAPPDPVDGPRWFVGARLSFTENLLRHRDEREALVFWNERGRGRAITYRELGDQVAAVAAALESEGVGPGDRVAGFLPNLPEAVIAMLAAASLGAIWSSCSPDFGANGVLDRFGQIRPRVLFCADSYLYAGKTIDSLGRVRDVLQRLPEIERVIVVPYLGGRPDLSAIPKGILWDDWVRQGAGAAPARRFPFDHPLYIK
jgi:acetoacetyl-CoA synthetase